MATEVSAPAPPMVQQAKQQLKNLVNGASPESHLEFSTIPQCIEAFRNGEFLIVLDNPTRENEGDLIIAARHMTPAQAAFMIRHTSGYLCAPLSPARAAALELPPMVAPAHSEDPHRTAYTITVDASGGGVGTGISAADRALTARVLGAAGSRAADLRRPGHIVPLISKSGGVRERRGHTEAATELARLAGLAPEVAVIGEMVVDGEYAGDGQPGMEGAGMMGAAECLEFGRRWGIHCCTVDALVEYVVQTEGPLGS